MAQEVKKLHMKYSLFGRNVNDTRSLEVLYRTGAATTNTQIRTLHQAFADLIKPCLPPQVQILRIVSSTARGYKMAHIKRGKQVPSKFNIAGTRANPDDLEISLLDEMAVWEKRTDGGYSGAVRLRGAFLQGDVVSVTGSPQLKAGFDSTPFTAFANGLMGIFTAAGCSLVLPAERGDDWITGARAVTSVIFDGVGLLKPVSRRRSLSENRKEYANGLLRSIAEQVYGLTHNPDGSLNVLSAVLIAAFAAEAAPLVADMGVAYIAQMAAFQELPIELQTAILALHA